VRFSIGVGEEAGRNHVARIHLKRRRQSIDCFCVLMLFAKNTTETHPGGEVGRMHAKACAENLLGLWETSVFSELFREREKKSALRIGLDPKLQLFNFCVDDWLSHLLEVRIVLNNNVRRNSGPRKRTAPDQRGRLDVTKF